jgi:glucokinase-like ROK family protein
VARRQVFEEQAVAPDQIDALVTVLDLVRSSTAVTRPELSRQSGLGRTVVTQRVDQLLQHGLIEEAGLGSSTGGRAPRELRFRAGAGHVLVGQFGATSLTVGLTDLAARVVEQHEEPLDIAVGPQPALDRLEELFTQLLDAVDHPDTPVWGIGVGLPGPVEFASGRPVAPPIMPGWDGYRVRDRLAARYDVPVWVDNEVNLMALGEWRGGVARSEQDVVYIKVGTGIGAGLISGGRLHRGAKGCAGDIGHVAVLDDPPVVCRCGHIGCLEALAGGAALAREGTAAAKNGRSPYLADLLANGRTIEAVDVGRGASHGDPASVELLQQSGRLVGDTLAGIVNFYNPALIVVGGGVAAAGDRWLATIRESVYRRSLPLATRDLRIIRSPLDHQAGLMGGAFMVVDELFSRERLGRWIGLGSPVGRLDLVSHAYAVR